MQKPAVSFSGYQTVQAFTKVLSINIGLLIKESGPKWAQW